LFFTVEANAALVTGGAGIAEEIARHMLKAGYEIIVLDRRNPEWTNMRLHADELGLLEADAVLLVRLSGATVQPFRSAATSTMPPTSLASCRRGHKFHIDLARRQVRRRQATEHRPA